MYSVITLSLLGLLGLIHGLVPKPLSQTVESELYFINETLEFSHDYPTCFILHDALRRFFQRLRDRQLPLHSSKQTMNLTNIVTTLTIHIESGCREDKQVLWPTEHSNENYSLVIEDNSIMLNAQEVWGILYGLETVAQLVRRTTWNSLVIGKQRICDTPKFPHRGYLIDTSSHFLTLPIISKFIDAMHMVKMNVLHWHIVDTHSFPYESYTYPMLSYKGAFDPTVSVYKRNDVKFVLEYARLRGVRVMPEFDAPDHSQSWGRGYPTLLTECFDKTGKPTGVLGPMNPARKETYEFLFNLLQEVIQVFPDSLIHVGGDEVDYACWASNPEIQTMMEEMKFGQNYSLLQTYFTEQLIKLIGRVETDKQTVIPVMWQEVFDNGLQMPNGTWIHVWKYGDWEKQMKSTTSAGYNVLFSSCWYLNYISYSTDWVNAYNCDPTDFGGTPEEINRIRGGEAAMWGPYVDDSNFFSQSWPRGAAVAERLWSTGQLSHDEFSPRLNELQCQMVRRGLAAQPANGVNYCP